jgi:hypothetical protein
MPRNSGYLLITKNWYANVNSQKIRQVTRNSLKLIRMEVLVAIYWH